MKIFLKLKIVFLFLILITLTFIPLSTGKVTLTNNLSYNSSLFLEINCSLIDGEVKPFSEINTGPIPIYNVEEGVDITRQYNEVGINFIRTHDFYGPTDISTIFPNFNADPHLENSYNFSKSDIYISGIINQGSEVLYRLGESASDNKSLRNPPENFSKWAEVCKHIVMHYNDGWNNGYYYNIDYWEIWNEPDLNGFWNGSANEYYNLYDITVNTLKSYNSSLKVGGPCTSSLINKNYTIGFLDYVTINDIPLDFYSWHQYANIPNELLTSCQYIRSLLDSYGLSDVESINTEWNINILTPQRDKDNAKNAAFTATSIIGFQKSNLDYAFRYRGTQDNNWLSRFIGFDLSLFSVDGKYKTPALVYLAMNHIIQDTPNMIKTEMINPENSLALLASISEDESNISILMSNYETTNKQYRFNLSNLPWNDDYKRVNYIIDDSYHLEIFEEEFSKGQNYTFSGVLAKSSVQFIRITNQSTIPDEGPDVAEIPLLLKLPLFDILGKILGIFLMVLIFG